MGVMALTGAEQPAICLREEVRPQALRQVPTFLALEQWGPMSGFPAEKELGAVARQASHQHSGQAASR
jgi:hypothetical protein